MTDTLRTPSTGPAVWHGPDLSDESRWVRTFTSKEIAELEAGLSAFKASGGQAIGFDRNSFPLPALSETLSATLSEVQHGKGFAVLRGLPVGEYNRQDLELLYWGIGAHLGQAISQNGEGQLLAEVTDRGSSYSTNINDRGYRSRDKLNPHVDTSDMTALLCVRQSDDGGMSSVASSAAIYNEILERRPDLLDIYYNGFHHDLRGEGPTRGHDAQRAAANSHLARRGV